MGGRACIRGMRIPVSVIIGQIAYGAAFEDPLPEGEGYHNYPNIISRPQSTQVYCSITGKGTDIIAFFVVQFGGRSYIDIKYS